MNLATIPEPRQRRKRGAAAPAAVGRAAIYVRTSTDEQPHSLVSQEAACRAECARRGLVVAGVYSDGGWSGGSLDRPALTELRSAVAAGEIATVVVCWSSSRPLVLAWSALRSHSTRQALQGA